MFGRVLNIQQVRLAFSQAMLGAHGSPKAYCLPRELKHQLGAALIFLAGSRQDVGMNVRVADVANSTSR